MNFIKAVTAGVLVWTCMVITFIILEHTPIIKYSLNAQTAIACVLVVFYARIGASYYYKKGNRAFGLSLGIIMSTTAVLLDVLLFVPLVEIPKGNTYQDFFSNPLLYLLAILNLLSVYFYWKQKIKIQ